MESASSDSSEAPKKRAPSLNYAESRRLHREVARKRIHEQVLHPIDTPSLLRDPLFHASSPIHKTIGSLKLLAAAVAVHVFIILVFAAVNDLMGEKSGYRPPERLVVQMIESVPPPPPPLPEQEDETVADAVPAPIPPDFAPKQPPPKKKPARKPKPPPKREKAPKPKPKDTSKKESENQAADSPPRRRTIGLDFESTTRGGTGPAMATGSSRMGETDQRATDPDLAKEPPSVGSTGGGTSSGETSRAIREQRTAANIPTRDVVFIKPKRRAPSKPPYPATLKAQGIEGDVQVRVRLDASGAVLGVSILRRSGHQAFDDAARDAALAEAFAPATRDGKAIPFTLSYSYRFRIEEN